MELNSLNNRLAIRLANLDEPGDQASIVELLDHYAEHPMGQGKPLADEILLQLIQALQSHPTTRVFLATDQDRAVGMATSFIGFSTFKARQLINVHDLIVHSECRGQGVGKMLLKAVADYARQNEFCAVTLEVKADNPARHLYEQVGFIGLSIPADEETMLFGKLPLD